MNSDAEISLDAHLHDQWRGLCEIRELIQRSIQNRHIGRVISLQEILEKVEILEAEAEQVYKGF